MEGESGPICERVERSTLEIRELVSPTGGMEDGSLFVQLDELGGIRLPTLQPNSELSVEGEAGSSIANSGHALLAQPVMVFISTGDVNRLSTELESMTSPTGTTHPLAEKDSIRLIAWNLSGIVSRGRAFRQMLSDFCWLQLGKIGTPHTNLPGRFRAIGAFNRIPCLSA